MTLNLSSFSTKFILFTLLVANPNYIMSQNKVPLPALSGKCEEASLLLVDAPHWDNGIACCSCHVPHQSADVQLTNVEGNANLCMSCHNPAGLASNKPFTNSDRADPGVSGTSHAWEVQAANSTHGAEPPSNPEMARRIYSNKIVCSSCHNQHSQTFSPFLRATNYQNALCKNCHAIRNVGSYRVSTDNKGSHPVGIVYATSDDRFHSSPQNPDIPLIDPDRVECTTCHSPHYADSGGANGGAGDGYILRAANDEALCQACHTYEEHMGQSCLKCHQPHDPNRINIFLVNDGVTTPNSGGRLVMFIAETGDNSFADGDSNYDGICEVCHTLTTHHRNDGSGSSGHHPRKNCVSCHKHEDAFHFSMPTNPSHITHIEVNSKGPTPLACEYCHGAGVYDIEVIVDNGTCDSCHSPGGFDGVQMAKTNWQSGVYQGNGLNLKPGNEQWCVTCHDGGTSVCDGASAPNLERFYGSGHGRSGANRECLDCHDVTNTHIDGEARTYAFDSAYYGPSQSGVVFASSYRLRYVGGEVPLMIPCNYNLTFSYNAQTMRDNAFRLCFDCHNASNTFDNTPGDGINSNFKASLPNPPRNYSYAWGSGADVNEHVSHILNYVGPFWDSDWDMSTNGPGGWNGNDCLMACSSCHNVHGAAGVEGSTNEAMLRDGSLVGRTGYGFSYLVEDAGSGGYPQVTSAGATQSTSVGAIFRNNTSNMCGGSMCHGNPASPPASSYNALGSSWGTYIEYYRPYNAY